MQGISTVEALTRLTRRVQPTKRLLGDSDSEKQKFCVRSR